MAKRIRWPANVVKFIFTYRYIICILFVFAIGFFGIFLYLYKHWHFKDAAQVCTGFSVLMTLFFAALNFEFASSKSKQDYKATRELTTFNTANEWHKSPLNEYQKESIRFEKKFIDSKAVRTANDFEGYINDPDNLVFKESLKGILNHFECVAIGTYNGQIDKDFIRRFYKSIFRIYYVDYLFYINSLRSVKKNEDIWVNFTNLAEEWHDNLKQDVIEHVFKSTIIT